MLKQSCSWCYIICMTVSLNIIFTISESIKIRGCLLRIARIIWKYDNETNIWHPNGNWSGIILGRPFLCSYDEEYMSSLISSDKIKARHFHSLKRFTDDLCAINDGGEFERSICDIYPKELELKFEHQGDRATLLNLGIIIKEKTFIFKFF